MDMVVKKSALDGLFSEIETLKGEVERLRKASFDALSGWVYIRNRYGDLSGVGWDRVEDALRAALAKAQKD